MALTRKMLKAMSIEDEQIDQIIEAHTESTDALKAERDKYKGEAEKIPELQKQIDSLKKDAELFEDEKAELQKKIDENESYKEKYEDEHNAFEDYKKGVDTQREEAKKADAYKELLKKAGVSDKRIDAILKVTSTADFELDDKGAIKDADKIVENIKSEWSEFIVTESKKGVDTENPPQNTGGKMTKEEIMKIKDRNARQEAIAENHELFGY
jgi:predicted RNase H-like nuclease (RuvC/YqgF family)